MEQDQRLQMLSRECADTHASEDIWEHLEEECIELLLAIKRVRRRREPMESVIEELIDVDIEINTVLTMIKQPAMVAEMLTKKLNKFETMLNKEKANYTINHVQLSLINRYKSLPEIF